jgi:uncharacterized protein (DUF2147 family)
MTRRYYLFLVCLALGLPCAAVLAAPAPVGYWLVQEGTSVVQIEESGGKLGGRIVWLKEPNYPPGDDEGRAGQPKVDVHNPDAAKRNRKLLGLPIVWGLSPPDANGVCDGGQVYDPRNGKTYSGTITMAGKDRLDLRGYILVSAIGRSSTWTRVDPGKYGLKP